MTKRANHTLQCGFCTPGIPDVVYRLSRPHPHPTTAEIRDVLSGHLCRCTGYTNIVKAVEEVAAKAE